MHRAARLAASILNRSVRCVKEAFCGCKCVFFCAWWGRWGRRRGGGLGGSEAPDADPLKKNKGGEAAEKRLKSQPNGWKREHTPLRTVRTHRRLLPAIHAENSHLCFPESAFPSVHVLKRSLHPLNQLRSQNRY